MPAGLFNSLAGFIGSLPCSALGNTPVSALFDLGKKLDECHVEEAADADKAA